jgi:hypothetical protein
MWTSGEPIRQAGVICIISLQESIRVREFLLLSLINLFLLAAHYSAKSQHDAVLGEILINNGLNPNTTDPEGFTPLHVAARVGKCVFADFVALALSDLDRSVHRWLICFSRVVYVFTSDHIGVVSLRSHNAILTGKSKRSF